MSRCGYLMDTQKWRMESFTRDVCGHWNNYCCYHGSYPIKVKACPGNYYVYELVRPTVSYSAYCADIGSINNSSTAVTPTSISMLICLIPATTTLYWIIHGEPPIIHMLQSEIVTDLSPGVAGFVSSLAV
ncbi:hypothetical protein QQF64_000003 [Cirrhinus molitorella]|uniref:UMOD/GP2/OIT3-like D8C domain-containing protein n=1 Tax=Cirrhinus molitorella TaxID=172907 RepID=A0ABR3NXI7_9TELE